MHERRRITIAGIVQGVGFRPFVFKLARRHGLVGRVRNDSAGVTLELQGEAEALEACLAALRKEHPPLAVIERITWEPVPVNGETAFTIEHSQAGREPEALVAPDVGICDDCLRELFDPQDRRYRYPFINCTNCGPRFTIIQDVPYDRPRTTMAAFRMCAHCQQEYDDPTDRRFHAQPNACPRCGPHVTLEGGLRDETGDHALQAAARLLENGSVLAVKGLGGYHLACDARQAQVVGRLRALKGRWDKPFALMAADLETARELAEVNEDEAALLTSRARPIVLLRARADTCLAPAVAPGQNTLGIMLPYSPLHYLLLDTFQTALGGQRRAVLVMTSGNRSDEPIAYRDEEARNRLADVADSFLVHDREIFRRCDDSVVKVVGGPSCVADPPAPGPIPQASEHCPPATILIRRARGYAPQPIAVGGAFARPVLAVGGHLKNTFCLAQGRRAYMSHHIGDLENLETLQALVEGVEHFQQLFGLTPAAIAHDLHPDYLSTHYALEAAEAAEVPAVPVQHHHAHIASVLAEHGLTGPVIGVAFDGTGYGTDGTVWGGEFLAADPRGFERLAHLAPVQMPGGEQAVRQPWRLAAAWLEQLYGDTWLELPVDFARDFDRRRWPVMRQMIARGLNCPPTTSMGRLFDAAAALLGVRSEVNYEGQAAVELEALATSAAGDTEGYRFDFDGQVIDPAPVFDGMVLDLQARRPAALIAARFHQAVVTMTAAVCVRLRNERGLNHVALSGGVFQNALLLGRTLESLRLLGFEAYTNQRVPPNDGGLALGQAAVAAAA